MSRDLLVQVAYVFLELPDFSCWSSIPVHFNSGKKLKTFLNLRCKVKKKLTLKYA